MCVLCCVVLCCAVLCCVVLCCAMLCYVVLCVHAVCVCVCVCVHPRPFNSAIACSGGRYGGGGGRVPVKMPEKY